MTVPSANSIINDLKGQLCEKSESSSHTVYQHPVWQAIFSGCELPEGALVEWLGSGSGQGLLTLVFWMLSISSRRGQIVVIDPQGNFFPGSCSLPGIPLSSLLVIRPGSSQDSLWATEQAIRCGGVDAVIGINLNLHHQKLRNTFRRFVLAAETGKTWGFLVETDAPSNGSRWSDLRLRVEAVPNCPLGVRRLKVRPVGGRIQGIYSRIDQEKIIEIDEFHGQIKDVTDCLSVPAALVDSTSPSYQARA